MPASQHGFTKFTLSEFETWIATQTVTRTVTHIQQHHTWRPNHAGFTGDNHFAMQRAMRNHHVGHNGWSDIGQHFSIFPDGAVLTGRALNLGPACIFNANSGGVCIENVGDFDIGRDRMPDAQRDSILRATAALLRRFSMIPRSDAGIVYHHWFDSSGNRTNGLNPVKSCPGSAFFGGNSVAAFNAGFLPGVLAALGGGAAAAATTTPPGVLRFVQVTAAALNVRQGPATSHPLVAGRAPLPAGAVARVWDERDGWLRTSNTREEWIFGRHTVPVRRAEVQVRDSNVRDLPAMTGTVVQVLQPGTVVFVAATSGEWAQLDPGHWIHQSLIRLD